MTRYLLVLGVVHVAEVILAVGRVVEVEIAQAAVVHGPSVVLKLNGK